MLTCSLVLTGPNETSRAVLGVIPARYGASRFPGKPLAAWGAGNIGTIVGLAVDAQGRVYVAASETKQLVRYVP